MYRVIGLPGERISTTDRRVYVNDQVLAEPYLADVETRSITPATVGAEQYFLLGDNRDNAHDSRAFGAVARNSITGVVDKIVLPKARVGPIPGAPAR